MNKHKLVVNFVLAFTKITGLIPALLLLKPKVYRQKGAHRRLPAPAILVSNHCSLIDFVLYLFVFPFRTLRFLMAEVLFNKGKLFASFLYALGGILVNRDAKDFAFVSNSLEVLDKGGIIGVFPEARLPVNGKPFPFTPSTAFIASKTDAPIIPVYTAGSYGLFKRAKVVIGAPVYFSDFEDKTLSSQQNLDNFTAHLQQTVYALASEIPSKKKA